VRLTQTAMVAHQATLSSEINQTHGDSIMTDPILNPGETVIRKAGGREYLSLGRVSAWLTLTNQRLIVQRLLGATSYYPLSHVTKVGIFDYRPPQALIVLFPFKLLRIDFDNGGAILFGLYEMPAWIQAIEQARVGVPQMPYTTTTPPIPQSEEARTQARVRMWIIVAVFSIIMFCTVALGFIAILTFYYFQVKLP